MRRPARILRSASLVLVGASLAASGAAADTVGGGSGPAVSILFEAYSPAQINVLAGDTVTWSNNSVRNHTVSADDGSWSSERLFNGDRFTHTYTTTGAFPYYCMVHSSMHGEVDVRRALLDAPSVAAAPRRAFPLAGRAGLPEGATVSIEADTGTGFQAVTKAIVGADGAFVASVMPQTTTTYRVAAAGETSPPVTLLVLDRSVTVSRTRARRGRFFLAAHVGPASPGMNVVLQYFLRERFGWWPVAQAHLDATSTAHFALQLRHRVPARVLLTLPDGATALASSRTVHVGGR